MVHVVHDHGAPHDDAAEQQVEVQGGVEKDVRKEGRDQGRQGVGVHLNDVVRVLERQGHHLAVHRIQEDDQVGPGRVPMKERLVLRGRVEELHHANEDPPEVQLHALEKCVVLGVLQEKLVVNPGH